VYLCPQVERDFKVYPGNGQNRSVVQQDHAVSVLVGERFWSGNWSPEVCTLNEQPRRRSDIKSPSKPFLSADAPMILDTTAYPPYNLYRVTLIGYAHDRMLGNRQTWGNTWLLDTMTHGGPNILFWDGHVERYIHPRGASFCGLFPQKRYTAEGTTFCVCP
jgi:prepilin-type processing-associated H-X9-DG protein